MPRKRANDMNDGIIHDSNKFGKFVIVEYFNAHTIKVRFLTTGYETFTDTSKIRTGVIKDPTLPVICGVGFIGVGDQKRSGDLLSLKASETWSNMIYRCYDDDTQEKSPTYKGCTVCDDWHDFQNFSKWYKERWFDGCHLDKDIKIKGNKIYSPDNCLLVSSFVNIFFTDSASARGEHPIGVSSWGGNFVARVGNPITSNSEYLGVFDDQDSAHSAWLKRKIEIRDELASIQDCKQVAGAISSYEFN